MPQNTTQRQTKRDAKIYHHEMNEEIDAAAIGELENAVASMLFRLWIRKKKERAGTVENKLKISDRNVL